jgi:MFS family permease
MSDLPTSTKKTLIPGTVHLVDLEGALRVKHSSGEKDVVLLPQPSQHFDDPLNWSRKRKIWCAIWLIIAVFSADISSTLLSPALLMISAETGIPLSTLNSGVGVQYLFFGWSNVIWQPLGLHYGRRPIILLGALGLLLCGLWTSYVKSSGEWYINRILVGAFYGPIETLIEVSIADIFFAHERGFWIGIYCWILFGIPFIGGTASGFVAANLGWKWIQYITTIIGAACTIGMFFFMEETMFWRAPVHDEAIGLDAEATPTTASLDEKSTTEEPTKEVPAIEEASANEEVLEFGGVVTEVHKTYIQKLKLWGARRPGQPNTFLRSLILPFVLLRFPGILFAAIVVGSILSVSIFWDQNFPFPWIERLLTTKFCSGSMLSAPQLLLFFQLSRIISHQTALA